MGNHGRIPTRRMPVCRIVGNRERRSGGAVGLTGSCWEADMTKHAKMVPEHHAVARKGTEGADAAFNQAPPPAPRAIMQRAALAPQSLRPADILRLQQTIGNHAVVRLLSQLSPARSLIQAKLTVNAP